jgi:hypothetical protein
MSDQENEFEFVKYIKDDEGFILGSEFFLKGIETPSNIGVRRILPENMKIPKIDERHIFNFEGDLLNKVSGVPEELVNVHFSIQREVHKSVVNDFDNQLKDAFKQALKENGYEVSEKDFIEFVNTRCSVFDYQDQKIKVFRIDSSEEYPESGTPVLEWHYDFNSKIEYKNHHSSFMTFEFGYYRIIKNE